MKKIIDKYYMIISLTVIALVSGVLLSFVYAKTEPAIIEAYRQDFIAGISKVLPEYINDPVIDNFKIDNKTIYPAKSIDNKTTAYAMEVIAPRGYGGSITMLVGVDVNGSLIGVYIVKHQETPGLGAKITKPAFLNEFKNINDASTIKTVKDGGDIISITAATSSSRAVSAAVAEGLIFLQQNLLTGGEL